MREADIQRVESALSVSLPEPYRRTLTDLGPSNLEVPELVTSADQLIEFNSHFALIPEDLSVLRGTGFLSRIRFFLFFKSPSRLIQQRSRYKQERAGRFIIGTDLGEEQYFIRLSEADPKVYCHQLETGAVTEAASSLTAWVSKARSAATSFA